MYISVCVCRNVPLEEEVIIDLDMLLMVIPHTDPVMETRQVRWSLAFLALFSWMLCSSSRQMPEQYTKLATTSFCAFLISIEQYCNEPKRRENILSLV